MSEEGGLEEVEESLRAAASCSCKRATVACNCCSCTSCVSARARCCYSSACKRWHSAQGLATASVMLLFYALAASPARLFPQNAPNDYHWESKIIFVCEQLRHIQP